MTITDAATFCTTMVDEWARAGISNAFVAPGSRSTPLALALAADRRLRINLFHDERAASFAALGHGLDSGRPGVVLCSSGTAATHFHAAVVEADLSGVPLLVCTADRPPELWHVGAPQTIDQTGLYGGAVRHRADPGVPDGAMAASWRSLASRLVAEACGWSGRPGPVHANLSFRDPLVGQPGPLPAGRPDGRPWHDVVAARSASATGSGALDEVAARLSSSGRARPGVIVAGRNAGDPREVAALAELLGWPVLADHRSGCRGEVAVRHFDGLLRVYSFARRVAPEVIVRLGEPLSSKVTNQWIRSCEAEIVSLIEDSRWIDPEWASDVVVATPGAVAGLVEALPADLEPAPSAKRWTEADSLAAEAIERVLAATAGLNEIDVARQAVAAVPSGGALVVSSSMPVRDVEWYGPARDDIVVHANRGANGIDGVIATAIGVALGGRPTTVLIGDVALLHDSTSLIRLADRPVDLHIVAVDNDGGGIFSFLPQATEVDRRVFENLFGTPHGTDLETLAAAHHIPVVPFPSVSGGRSGSGPRLSVLRTSREANVALHDEVNRAIAAAVA